MQIYVNNVALPHPNETFGQEDLFNSVQKWIKNPGPISLSNLSGSEIASQEKAQNAYLYMGEVEETLNGDVFYPPTSFEFGKEVCWRDISAPQFIKFTVHQNDHFLSEPDESNSLGENTTTQNILKKIKDDKIPKTSTAKDTASNLNINKNYSSPIYHTQALEQEIDEAYASLEKMRDYLIVESDGHLRGSTNTSTSFCIMNDWRMSNSKPDMPGAEEFMHNRNALHDEIIQPLFDAVPKTFPDLHEEQLVRYKTKEIEQVQFDQIYLLTERREKELKAVLRENQALRKNLIKHADNQVVTKWNQFIQGNHLCQLKF